MKELYLVPKHIYEVMNNGNSIIKNTDGNNNSTIGEDTEMDHNQNKVITPKPGEKWRTRILPPPVQNKIRLNEIAVPEKNIKTPPLYEHLNLRISNNEIGRARIILKHIEKSNKIFWDDYGDIYTPLNNYNIINIIYDFIYQVDIRDPKKLGDYRYIITITDIPLHMIKNKHILDFIRMNGRVNSPRKKKKKVGAGGVFLKKKSSGISNWKIY